MFIAVIIFFFAARRFFDFNEYPSSRKQQNLQDIFSSSFCFCYIYNRGLISPPASRRPRQYFIDLDWKCSVEAVAADLLGWNWLLFMNLNWSCMVITQGWSFCIRSELEKSYLSFLLKAHIFSFYMPDIYLLNFQIENYK